MKFEKLEQRVEILAQKIENGAGGGGSVDAYTKAQADAKFETQSHASETYQTKSGMSSYATTTDISDMATKTWVGEQGYMTNADEVPTVGSTDNGKVLTASYSSDTGSYSWESLPSVDEVPTVTSNDNGKVLTATYSGGTGSYAWAQAASGGLSVETDGTNYWITVNGIRLYFASSAPTGTIPDGSMGIGW